MIFLEYNIECFLSNEYFLSFFYKLVNSPSPSFEKTYPFVLGFALVIIALSVLLPINGYFLVMIGLALDILGAILIISPLINQYLINYNQRFFKSSTEVFNQMREDRILISNQNRARLGLLILIFGFALQILGNYFQYLNS